MGIARYNTSQGHTSLRRWRYCMLPLDDKITEVSLERSPLY